MIVDDVYDFITDISFSLIELVRPSTALAAGGNALENEGNAPVVESRVINGTATFAWRNLYIL